jgi:membrane-associated phospholipid phosphatase
VSISKVVDHGQGLSNPVAAMPSLHAAFALLITLFLWKSTRWWWRVPLAAYPLAMGFTLMYFGEHYAVDILAGWLYAVGAYLLVERLARRRERKAKSAVERKTRAITPVAVTQNLPS